MKNYYNLFMALLLLVLLHPPSVVAQKKEYVVYLGEHGGGKTSDEIEDSHQSYLVHLKGSKEAAKASLIHSYKNVINGFSALLTPDEAKTLSEMDQVVSVFESSINALQTTRSWDFVNLLQQGFSQPSSRNYQEDELLRKARYGEDVIVGLFDTGVWPESESFNADGMKPIPKSWKGICQEGTAFNSSHCNSKLIGARYYLKGYEAKYGPIDETVNFRSPRDTIGHGTLTASILGGRKVYNTSNRDGFGFGTATGGAPMVRLAIYKIGWTAQYTESDLLAAFDDAIADGVQVMSLSLGAPQTVHYTNNAIAVGALHAIKRNIVVACSAGNSGPSPSTVTNIAPWVITVAASSTDRVFSSPVVLGNGIHVQGQSVTPYKLDSMYPLVFAGDAELVTEGGIMAGKCLPDSLSPELVEGKVVFCLASNYNTTRISLEVKRAGGVGVVLQNHDAGMGIEVDSFVIPGTCIVHKDADIILSYIRNHKNPSATILPVITTFDNPKSPFVTVFSSTGPNKAQPDIIKPDITAPGLNILAAYTEAKFEETDSSSVAKYQISSGTSFSCPHLAAAAALLKAVHPKWSSAAIRSALMTTAGQTNNGGSPITRADGGIANPFDYGSGHFRPAIAADPGLVYDASYMDYLLFLCNSGDNKVDRSFRCPKNYPTPSNLNYPSVGVTCRLNKTTVVKRTVTNAGEPSCVYNVSLQSPPGYIMEIFPMTLKFSAVGDKRSFLITIRPLTGSVQSNGYSFGWYSWNDGVHTVKSPVAVSSAN